jgi:hypothetical protein
MDALFTTLNQRKRPEDVAQMVLEQLRDNLLPWQERLLDRAAHGSLKRQFWGYTSMLQEFACPVGLRRQVAKANELFATAYPLSPEQCDDPQIVEVFLLHVDREVWKAYGKNDFRHDRLNAEARAAAGLDISKRRYNKLWRHLKRMEQKLGRLVREIKKREFQQVSKSGLAHTLSWEEFRKNENSACFIAYYTARCRLRSEFTIYGQQRPYDEIADMLLERCRADAEANWWAIAHVYSAHEVLGRLTDAQKGELLGRWFGILQEVGALLAETWERSDINRATMVVRRGNDSSTWNNTAGAWNKARDAWIELVYALGMEAMLDSLCFGKALRLMAADVVAWHRLAGNTLDPNTFVWSELPLPWEVLRGQATCTRGRIEAVCHKHGLDPEKSGWVAPRPRTHIAAFRPTPELVHGVTVGNPYLASLLKKAGFFSGKPPTIPLP